MAQVAVLGYQAKVDIGDSLLPFRVLSGTITDNADVNETTDSETDINQGQCKEFHPNGLFSARIDIEIQLDTDTLNPTSQMFTNGLQLVPGNSIPMNVWPEGRNVDNSDWAFSSVIPQGGPYNFTPRGSVPQTHRISFQANGYYKRPFETSLVILNPVVRRRNS